MTVAADFAAVAELAARIDAQPELAEILGNADPQGLEAVLRVAEFPLVRWQPFGYTLDDGNPCQIGCCQSNARERWATAGNRGGKSLMGAMEDTADALNIDVITKRPSAVYQGPASIWVVSDTEQMSVEIMQRTFADDVLGNNQLSFGWELVKDEVHYSAKGGFRNNWLGFTNGSSIDFKYSSAGRESFQGTKIHKVHFDEVPPKDVYQESYARTLDFEGQILGTCTPIYSRIHGIPWIYQDLYVPRDAKGIAFFSWSLFHNPYLSQAAKDALVAQWDEDEMDARAYGMFTPIGMNLAFDRKLLRKLKDGAEDPLVVGWPRRNDRGEVEIAPVAQAEAA